MIDPPVPLFKPELFFSFLTFAGTYWEDGREIVIHCNRGESRSPSLAMILLAKHIGVVSDDSFDTARKELQTMYPNYHPGAGIQTYLRENWHSLESTPS